MHIRFICILQTSPHYWKKKLETKYWAGEFIMLKELENGEIKDFYYISKAQYYNS